MTDEQLNSKENQSQKNILEDTESEAINESEMETENQPVQEDQTENVLHDDELEDEMSEDFLERQWQDEKAALEDQILRLQAEIANIQRRNTKERQESTKYRSQSLASRLLDGIDNLERALAIETQSEDGLAINKGIEMVHQQFLHAFQEENINIINPVGEPFDPNYHQAVTVAPATEEFPDSHVVQVLQKGYCIDQRVIRPAMVIVAQA